jgi:hypothetical protein
VHQPLRDIPPSENRAMRSLLLTGTALLAAALVTACGPDSNPITESTPVLLADAADHNTADHFTSVEAVTFEVENPCNGEIIVFSGVARSQSTVVDTREHLDAGFSLHMELQSNTQATGTGPESGASYELKDIYHEGFDSPNPPAPHATFSGHATTHITSDLPGLSFDLRFLFHGVVPSGKDFKVTREVESAECRG